MNRYTYILLIGLSVWIIETIYFGFNREPESGLEAMLDTLSWVFIIWGIIGDILKGVNISKNINIKADTGHIHREEIGDYSITDIRLKSKKKP